VQITAQPFSSASLQIVLDAFAPSQMIIQDALFSMALN
jgi:hypothetical protein